MAMQDTLPSSGAMRWKLIAILAAVTALALWFIQNSALTYLSYDAQTYGDFWPRRFGLIPHILGGVVAILTGVVQIWLGVTGRTRQLHRTLGKVYLGAVTVGSLGGFYLALTINGPLPYAAGLFFLSVAWALTTSVAYLAARRRAIEQHREWMLRSYIVTFAFVSFRLTAHLAGGLHLAPAMEVDTTIAWACWSVPLLLAEPLLQARKLRRR